ncbi:MAG: hypothetical protein GF353_12100, partial [Candidatus Lokiarchaeota archaeon]|nr:hypothetical protein [Candidatus Lokiarchaeota archaeon]
MKDKDKLQLCRFCQRQVRLAYYCEECGASCCSDCLSEERVDSYTCQDCQSKNIKIDEENNNKQICANCSSENIIKTTQLLKSCPKCYSHRIINIYEKKEELEQKFLELIKQTRAFINPIRDIISELYIVREKIKKARGPPIRCYHYPKMESELLELFNLIHFLKKNLLGKINTHFRHLALYKENFFDVYNQPNSNIRIIESILDNLNRSFDSIKKYIENTISKISEKFEDFENNLRFIEKITKRFLPYKGLINLADDEKPVYAIRTKLTNGLDTNNTFKKSKGILFITNFDLSFVHEYGLFKTKRKLIFKAPVDDLINIEDKGTLFKKLFVQFEYGKYEFSLPSDFIPKVIEYIILAKSFRDNSTYDKSAAQQLFAMNLDLSELVKYIEEGINTFFSLKMKHSEKMYNIDKENEKRAEKKEKSQYNGIKVPRSEEYIPNINSNRNYNNYHQNFKPESYEYLKHINSNDQYNGDPNYYRNNNFPPQQQFIHPFNFYYRDNYNNIFPPKYHHYGFNQDNFYFNPNEHMRYKNYLSPHEHNLRNNFDYPQINPYMQNFNKNFDENSIIRNLKRTQKYKYHSPNSSRFSNYSNHPDFYHNHDNPFSEKGVNPIYEGPNSNSYVTSNRSHLSDSFINNSNHAYHESQDDTDLFNYDDNKKRNLDDLKREKYSVEKTLKKLDEKFDKGNISEVDYI